MATKQSAGILLYRIRDAVVEVLLVHPGGPFWSKKDDGAWFIPKGELSEGEAPLDAARREFAEELGSPLPSGELRSLGSVKNKSGKLIHAWALQADFDVSGLESNTFSIEWPPRSGKQREFPEVDRAEFFTVERAVVKMHSAELPLLERLAASLLDANSSDL